METAPADATAAPMEDSPQDQEADTSMILAAMHMALDIAAQDTAFSAAITSNPDVSFTTADDGTITVTCGDASVTVTADMLGGDEPVDVPDEEG